MNPFAQALSEALSYGIVSAAVSEHGIGFLYREAAAFEQDSGWRFFSGGESDEFCADSANFSVQPLSDIRAAHPEITGILNQREGAWEWDEASETFIAAADWQPEKQTD